MKLITDMTPTPENQEIIYNSLDTMQTMKLKELFDAGLLPDWAAVSYGFSEKMLGPVMTMMRRGVRIDLKKRNEVVKLLQARAAKVRSTFDTICVALFDTTININSRPQLDALFHTFLGIPQQIRSKKGETKASLDKDALEKIAKDYPRGAVFCNLILKVRDLEKQVEFLLKSLSSSGRFHTSYNISGTETFRVSSSEHPLRIGSNQQNIPRDNDIRATFASDPGYLFFQADQQGAEARLVAYRSGDEAYIEACESGDAHTMVASLVFGFEPIRELAERDFKHGKSYRQASKSGSHGCLTAEHEVLTPQGWVSIANTPTTIAMWCPTDSTITWNNPSNWLQKETTELVTIRGPSISSVSTPEHKFIVDCSGKLVERTATTFRKNDRIPYTGVYTGGTTSVRYARLVAAYQADGSQSYYKNIRFKFRRTRKIERMRQLLKKHQIDYSENVYGNDTIFVLEVKASREIANWGKVAGPQFLQWDQDSLSAYVDESIYWDGTQAPSGRTAVCSVNLEHCRWLQTLFQLCGFGSKVIDNTGETRTKAFGTQRPHWVSKNNRKLASLTSCTILLHNCLPTKVYCPTVTTGYFMVRHKGHIHVTGNSNYMGKPYTLAQQMGVPQEAAEEFQIKYFKRFPGIQHWHVETAKQLQQHGWLENPFGMRRTFWQRRWDDATLREAIAFYPQSAVGVLTNIILYKLWLKYEGQPGAPVQILMNGHDAVIGQVREDLAPTLIPQLLKDMEFPFPITDIHGKVRTVTIPFDMEVGYNWGKFDEKTNPTGLKKWKATA